MKPNNAALLALFGTILMSALQLWTFVFTLLNVLRGFAADRAHFGEEMPFRCHDTTNAHAVYLAGIDADLSVPLSSSYTEIPLCGICLLERGLAWSKRLIR